jgi:hypothetical protein
MFLMSSVCGSFHAFRHIADRDVQLKMNTAGAIETPYVDKIVCRDGGWHARARSY